jgi:hypothetical protein
MDSEDERCGGVIVRAAQIDGSQFAMNAQAPPGSGHRMAGPERGASVCLRPGRQGRGLTESSLARAPALSLKYSLLIST